MIAEAEYVDELGAETGLRSLTASWEDIQKTRLASAQRGRDDLADALKLLEDRESRKIKRELERHILWPWLKQYPGLGGVHTARVIALIGDPLRFPGRKCEAGHYHSAAEPVREGELAVGCGIELADGTVCTAPVGQPRRGTGVRSLWHWAGLHVVDGHAPRNRKGVRADWNPVAKTAVLMPGGIAEQIVRLRVPKYRDIYDQTKDRLTRERAAGPIEIDALAGPLPTNTAEADPRAEIELQPGLRPFQIDAIARKVAAKAFLGDMLIVWKGALSPSACV